MLFGPRCMKCMQDLGEETYYSLLKGIPDCEMERDVPVFPKEKTQC